MDVFRGKESVFSVRLRDLRNSVGLSQQTVANMIGITKSSLSLYECGLTLPDAEKIYRLAQLYDVSADYLLGLSDFPATSKAYCEEYAKSLLRVISNIYEQIKPVMED